MKNRTILVTGGNRGIGKAIVEGLAINKSNTILLGCRNLDEGQKLALDIGDNVNAIAMDLSSKKTLDFDIKALLKDHPSIDVLINNAGILREGDLSNCSIDDVETSLQVNTVGPIHLTKELLPGMIKRSYGRIVNISSGWGSFEEGLSGPFCYSLSKAAMNAFTLSVANRLQGDIKINSVSPGWVRTQMGGMMAPRSPEEGADTAIWLANIPEDGPNGGFFRDRKLIQW